jgi:hypothetical protein
MNFLIDGHNLIGSNLFSDIRLSDEDDEAKLVMRLKIWQSRAHGTMTVIFDRGIPGGIDVKMGSAGVQVIFAADPAQADDLIRRRLRKAKKGLILVTNDEALLREAAIYEVTGWHGAEFVEWMKPKIPERPEAGTESDVQLSKAEVDEWLALFRADWLAKKALKKQMSADGHAQSPGKAATKRGGRGSATPLGRPTTASPEKPQGNPQKRPPEPPTATPARKAALQPQGSVPAKPPDKPSAQPSGKSSANARRKKRKADGKRR